MDENGLEVVIMTINDLLILEKISKEDRLCLLNGIRRLLEFIEKGKDRPGGLICEILDPEIKK